jgi:hypothetical protein
VVVVKLKDEGGRMKDDPTLRVIAELTRLFTFVQPENTDRR